MRGDSLRDLYAKTLALLGLGVLAGAGALVDYWPVGVTVPDASAVIDRPAPAPPFSMGDEPGIQPLRAATRSRRNTEAAPRLGSTTFRLDAIPVNEPSVGVGVPVGLGAPVMHQASIFTPASSDVTAAVLQLSMASLDDGVPLQLPVAASAESVESDGFIAGAFRRTGNSIIKSGARTKSSIVDAMRVVGGAVRKALPN